MPGISARRGTSFRPSVAPSRGTEARRPSGVGMTRMPENLAHGRLLDLPPGIHDDDALRHLGDDAEVMGNENDGGADLAP